MLWFSVDLSDEDSVFHASMIKEKVLGHLKLKGTLIGALLAMELGSTLKMSVSPEPYVHLGSADITSCECLRHTRKKMWQSCEFLHTPPGLVNECTFSSNTPDESTSWDAVKIKMHVDKK